ncbi:hypothetical protein J6590_039731 [Homalodisca vitripennis]|nr:hypothetical protein J6590_039731 [Homalodisca vitripennis]
MKIFTEPEKHAFLSSLNVKLPDNDLVAATPDDLVAATSDDCSAQTFYGKNTLAFEYLSSMFPEVSTRTVTHVDRQTDAILSTARVNVSYNALNEKRAANLDNGRTGSDDGFSVRAGRSLDPGIPQSYIVYYRSGRCLGGEGVMNTNSQDDVSRVPEVCHPDSQVPLEICPPLSRRAADFTNSEIYSLIKVAGSKSTTIPDQTHIPHIMRS